MLKHKLVSSWGHLRQSMLKFRRGGAGVPPLLPEIRGGPPGKPLDGRNRAKEVALFARAILANPRATGAALPSSARLARAMAAAVPVDLPGLVLELGAGTGIVTEALLRRGIPPERLVVIELSPTLAGHLRLRFPHLRVIEGDAVHLKTLLGDDYARIGAVVSSLPLRSLPRNVVYSILRHLDRLLGHGGLLVQFTYDLGPGSRRLLKRFTLVSSKIVWQNVPPAKVLVFKHQPPRASGA